MSRIDVPTLQCDRCQAVTQDLTEMARFKELSHYYTGGQDAWDMCPACWVKFMAFMIALVDGSDD